MEYRSTESGFSPKERVLMMGFLGLLFTSTTGERLKCMPTARLSSAAMRPAS